MKTQLLNIFLLLSIIIIAFSCNNQSQSMSKKITEKELDAILKSNSDEFVFMKFHPEMEEYVFKKLINRYISKGILYNKDIYENENEIFDKLLKPHYKIKFNNEELEFTVSKNLNSIELHSYNSFYLNKSNVSPRDYHYDNKKYEYQEKFKNLLNLFKEKYGEYSTISDKSNNSFFVFNKHNKIIHIKGEYSGYNYDGFLMKKNGDVKYFTYIISIEFYSEKSFAKMKELKEIMRKKEDSIEQKKRKRKLEIEKKQREKLLNDI